MSQPPTPVESPKHSTAPRLTDRDVQGLVPLVYDELVTIARGLMNRERWNHTLSPTALVHETYVKIARSRLPRCRDRHHFVALAARAMRQVLVTHAESRSAQKRGGGRRQESMDSVVAAFEDGSVDLVALDDSLRRLSELDEAQAQLVELRFFGGLSMREAAEVTGLPLRTAERELALARAWLRRELADGSDAADAPMKRATLRRATGK